MRFRVNAFTRYVTQSTPPSFRPSLTQQFTHKHTHSFVFTSVFCVFCVSACLSGKICVLTRCSQSDGNGTLLLGNVMLTRFSFFFSFRGRPNSAFIDNFRSSRSREQNHFLPGKSREFFFSFSTHDFVAFNAFHTCLQFFLTVPVPENGNSRSREQEFPGILIIFLLYTSAAFFFVCASALVYKKNFPGNSREFSFLGTGTVL